MLSKASDLLPIWEQSGARNKRWKEAVLRAYQKLNAGDKAIIDDCVEGLCLNTRLGLQGAYELLAAIGIHSLETVTPEQYNNKGLACAKTKPRNKKNG